MSADCGATWFGFPCENEAPNHMDHWIDDLTGKVAAALEDRREEDA